MEFTPEFVNNIEEKTGLPIGLIRKLDPTHFSFYLQNKDKMKIEERDGKIKYVIKNINLIRKYYSTKEESNKRLLVSIFETLTIGEKEFDNFLDRIYFRGPKINTKYRTKFLTSKQIDKLIDDILN